MAHFEVLVGTTLGGAEYVSDELILELEKSGHSTTQYLIPNLTQLNDSGYWLVVCSTHGAGELPDNIEPFYQQLLDQKPDLSDVKFIICAIGDSNYDTFCQGPEKLIECFQQLGAQAFVDKIQIDVQDDQLPEDIAHAWCDQWKDQLL